MRERAGMRPYSNRADGNLSPGHQTSPPDESTHPWSMLCRVVNQEATRKLQTAATTTELVHMIEDLIADKIGGLSYRLLFIQPPT